MEKDKYTLGKEIKFFCKKKWGTQVKAAKLLEVSPEVLSFVISGKREPSRELMLRLADYGFDEEKFKKHFFHKKDDFAALTKEQLIDLIKGYANLVEDQRNIIRTISEQNTKQINEIHNMRKEVIELIKRIK